MASFDWDWHLKGILERIRKKTMEIPLTRVFSWQYQTTTTIRTTITKKKNKMQGELFSQNYRTVFWREKIFPMITFMSKNLVMGEMHYFDTFSNLWAFGELCKRSHGYICQVDSLLSWPFKKVKEKLIFLVRVCLVPSKALHKPGNNDLSFKMIIFWRQNNPVQMESLNGEILWVVFFAERFGGAVVIISPVFSTGCFNTSITKYCLF